MTLKDLFDAIYAKDYSEVVAAIKKDPSLATQKNEEDGVTAIMVAAAVGEPTVIDCLLQLGADPLEGDDEGYNAIWQANEGDVNIKSRELLAINVMVSKLPGLAALIKNS